MTSGEERKHFGIPGPDSRSKSDRKSVESPEKSCRQKIRLKSELWRTSER